ncbi:hypothetical protein LF887_20470 [Chryseobacterium sp. MEBOG06]|uniref:hypothetical protein n=1 Tax=Chryseobacterium sp. MEBOG06 TaxID=2879938 RepID=UPI001F27DDB0|nr:hypothetical protein [Chryseobacterium sp. MEBOG06]UKB83361.1 hypothetical protein LF887_20470 [Chryseobacterium sp. MEBOG06]
MKTVYKIIVIILIIISIKTLASPQMPDYIIYKNDTIPTYNLILEKYLQKINPGKDQLFGLSFRNRESFGVPLNCWRGYQAIYEVIDEKLYLTRIISCGELQGKSKINIEESTRKITEIFGNNVRNNRVLIDWFSGVINFPKK